MPHLQKFREQFKLHEIREIKDPRNISAIWYVHVHVHGNTYMYMYTLLTRDKIQHFAMQQQGVQYVDKVL